MSHVTNSIILIARYIYFYKEKKQKESISNCRFYFSFVSYKRNHFRINVNYVGCMACIAFIICLLFSPNKTKHQISQTIKTKTKRKINLCLHSVRKIEEFVVTKSDFSYFIF